MSQSVRKVIIVGGGIAGLALAKSLLRVGITSTVFEQAPEIKNIGGGLTIYPHGALALSSMGLGEEVRNISHEVEFYSVFDGDEILMQDNLKVLKSFAGASIHSFSRHELQTLIMNSLPKNIFQPATKIVGITSTPERAEVTIEGGQKVDADLVVIANGSRSSLFPEYVLGEGRQLKYCGYSFWGGFLGTDQLLDLRGHSMLTILGSDKTAFILTLPGDRQWFYLVAKIGDPCSLVKGSKNLSIAQAVFKGWSRRVDQILSYGEDAFHFGLPVFEVPFRNRWYNERIVGIGDCVHGLGPTAGQGANAALTDALALSLSLFKEPDVRTALRVFSELRTEFITQLYEVEMKSARSKMTSNEKEKETRKLKYLAKSINDLMEPVVKSSQFHQPLFSFFESLK